MRAVQIVDPGPQSQLTISDVPEPEPGPDELLVQVRATALNRADLLQRSGNYPPPPGASEILGLEMAGEVVRWGDNCTGWQAGDRVMALLPGGGYAEYVTIPSGMAMPIPAGMSFEAAAAIPEVFLTAYQALDWLGGLKKTETVLIHAGASGVGTAAIQIAKERGAQVFVTASAGKHAACKSLGAGLTIDYKSERFDEVVQQATDGAGVDLIVDFLGASYFAQNIQSLGLDGRLVLLALMGGSKIESVNLGNVFRKRIHIKASTLRSRSLSYKVALTEAFSKNFLPLFAAGTLKPIIDQVFDWEEVNDAHARMAANLNTGKIVLKVSA